MAETIEQRLERVKPFIPQNVNSLGPADFYFAYKQGLLAGWLAEKGYSSARKANNKVPNNVSYEQNKKMKIVERDKLIRESSSSVAKLALDFGLSKARIYKIRGGGKC